MQRPHNASQVLPVNHNELLVSPGTGIPNLDAAITLTDTVSRITGKPIAGQFFHFVRLCLSIIEETLSLELKVGCIAVSRRSGFNDRNKDWQHQHHRQ
jgi:hypothetical protein